jgi:hypothetical protein
LVDDPLRLAPPVVRRLAVEHEVVAGGEGGWEGPGEAPHDRHDPARVGLVDGDEDPHRVADGTAIRSGPWAGYPAL